MTHPRSVTVICDLAHISGQDGASDGTTVVATLSDWDEDSRTGEIVVPSSIRATVSAGANIAMLDLWPNSLGTRDTHYEFTFFDSHGRTIDLRRRHVVPCVDVPVNITQLAEADGLVGPVDAPMLVPTTLELGPEIAPGAVVSEIAAPVEGADYQIVEAASTAFELQGTSVALRAVPPVGEYPLTVERHEAGAVVAAEQTVMRVTLSSAGVMAPPAGFGAGQWSLADSPSADGDRLVLGVVSLPDPGGAAIEELQYRVNGGATQVLAGTEPGTREIVVPAGAAASVELRAVGIAGAGPWTDVKTALPTALATGPAAFVAADWSLANSPAPGGDRLALTVASLPADGGAALVLLEYRINGGAVLPLPGGVFPGTRQIAVPAGVSAAVEIRALNAEGAGPWSDLKAATPTASASAPVAFAAGQWSLTDSPSTGGNQLSLEILALPDDGGAALSALEYRVAGGAVQTLFGTGAGARMITVLAGATASVEIRAVNGEGPGPWSDVKSATPSVLVTATAPAAFAAGQWSLTDTPSLGGNQLTLTVAALPADGGSAITELQYQLNSGAAQTLAGTAAGPRTLTVPAGALATLAIRAVNAEGTAPWSDVKSATPTALVTTTPPAAFGAGQWNLADSPSAAGDQLALSIIALPADGGTALSALEYRVNGGAAVALAGTGAGTQAITVPAGAAASVEVRAVNAEGAGPWSAVKLATPTALVTTTPPAAFGAGQWSLSDLPSAGGDQLSLSITALPADGGATLSALQYRLGNGAPQTLSGTGVGTRTMTVLALSPADVQLRAVNAEGAGPWSDVKSATPSQTVQAGEVAIQAIDTEGWRLTPASYAAPDPSTNFVTVTGPGHDAAGNATTIARPIYLSGEVRVGGGTNPNGTQVSAYRRIYKDDAIVGATNDSSVDYPKVHANWTTPPRRTVHAGEGFTVRIAAYHRHGQNGKPLAAVRFILRDHLGGEATVLVTEPMVKHYSTGSGLYATEYEGTIPWSAIQTLATFGASDYASASRNDLPLTLDAAFLPWVGPEQLLSTIYPGREQIHANDVGGFLGQVVAYVDPAASGAGVFADSRTSSDFAADLAAAEANPYADTKTAYEAMRAHRIANVGRGRADGMVIRLVAGTHQYVAPTVGGLNDIGSLTLEGVDTATPAQVVLTPPSSTPDTSYHKLIVRNLTLRKGSAGGNRNLFFTWDAPESYDVQVLSFEAVVKDDPATDTAGRNYWSRYDETYYFDCGKTDPATGSTGLYLVGCSEGFDVASQCQFWHASRLDTLCQFNFQSQADKHQISMCDIALDCAGLTGAALFLGEDAGSALGGGNADWEDVAWIGTLFRCYNVGGYGNIPPANFGMLGDGSEVNARNITILGCSFWGGRMNSGYTDSVVPGLDRDIVMKNSSVERASRKSGDFFAISGRNPNSARQENWAWRYQVDCANTVIWAGGDPGAGSGDQDGFFARSWAGDVRPENGFGTNQYAAGAGTPYPDVYTPPVVNFAVTAGSAGGDYRWDAAHPNFGDVPTVPSSDVGYLCDFAGNPIPLDGSARTGALVNPS